jgi:hypothetical protein
MDNTSWKKHEIRGKFKMRIFGGSKENNSVELFLVFLPDKSR